MKKFDIIKLGFITMFLCATMFITACGEENQSAAVDVSFSSFTTAHNDRPLEKINSPLNWLTDLVVPQAKAAVSSLQFCFKRLRFKTDETTAADPTADEDNVDFDLGEVTIDAAGTFLGSISVPVGTYSRVEFDLEDTCSSGNSIGLINDNGTFTSQDRTTIRFEGTLEITEDSSVSLGVQQILDGLNSFNTPSDSQALRDAAEAIAGTL